MAEGIQQTIHEPGSRRKLCILYDSNAPAAGQAYDIALTTQMDGWKELVFSLPYVVDGKDNWRNGFIRSEYLVRLLRGKSEDWFILHAPTQTHKGMSLGFTVTCSHVSSLLNKKNLYLYFDDTNGIGTAEQLLERALAGTGWALGFCETFRERDGETEKIRSLKADEKRGTFLLIADICELFNGYPVFHGDTKTVDVYSLNRRDALLELNFGKNLSSVSRKENTENIVTRLYVEGEYTDHGYVGIDDVNPTGLPFLFDFSYYKEIGAFTEDHQAALDTYIAEVATIHSEGMVNAAEAQALETALMKLWGQIDYAVYVLDGGEVSRTILGGNATMEKARLEAGDEVTILLPDQTYTRRVVTTDDPTYTSTDLYGVKFITKATAEIGGKEVAVEAKQIMLAKYQAQWDGEMSESKRETLRKQIGETEAGITALHQGTEESDGLYALMKRAVETAVLMADATTRAKISAAAQADADSHLASVLGDMLRDGYWSNTSYTPGQEESLYLDALDIMEEVAKPNVSYTVTIQNLSGISGYEEEQFKLHMAVRIWDEALKLNDYAYVSKLTEHLDAPHKDSITISNEAMRIGSSTLESILRRISMVAEAVNRKNALYDRVKAIDGDGSIPMQRLKGTIDVLKTRLFSSVSNWYTDDNGNIMLESLDGRSAMMLCGEGFMIASSKTGDGLWDWRTFGTGEGFTADAIIAGFLSADRIEANTITANKLASDVGESLDLSSNRSISLIVENVVDSAIGDAVGDAIGDAVGYRVEIIPSNGSVLSEFVPQTTLTARVWRGAVEVTDALLPGQFAWIRISADTEADAQWNITHRGMKQIIVGAADILYCATYRCDVGLDV